MLRAIAFSLLTVACLAAGPAFAGDLDPMLAKAMEGSKVPAMGMLVIQNGKIVGSAVRGVRRMGGAEPVQPDDLWLIGSNAKVMTAMLIVKLAERGQLSLDAPLTQLMPAFAAKVRPEYRTVTLKQLLSHSAGLPHDSSDLKFFMRFFPTSARCRSRGSLMSRAP